jgi:hypothetical protein
MNKAAGNEATPQPSATHRARRTLALASFALTLAVDPPHRRATELEEEMKMMRFSWGKDNKDDWEIEDEARREAAAAQQS